MTERDPDRPDLSNADARLVSRIEELSRTPEQTVTRRVAFQEELDRRTARRSRRLLRPAWVGALAMGVAAIALVRVGLDGSPDPKDPSSNGSTAGIDHVTTPATSTTNASIEAMLSLMDEESQPTHSDLPADYVAIGSLFLGT